MDRSDDAREAYDRAIGLSEDPAVRAFVVERRIALRAQGAGLPRRRHATPRC